MAKQQKPKPRFVLSLSIINPETGHMVEHSFTAVLVREPDTVDFGQGIASLVDAAAPYLIPNDPDISGSVLGAAAVACLT